MGSSLISVICLCYNHERFVQKAIDSVLNQTYKHVELIVVDDCSTDRSKYVIEEMVKKHPEIRFIYNDQNEGMCKSFNKAFKQSKGEFVINLAADDVLHADMFEKQLKVFESLGESYGIVYSDAYLIDESGKKIKTFYKRDQQDQIIQTPPQGDVFAEVIKGYQVCSQTMLSRRVVFQKLDGYDEELNYEDFDYFIRSSRYFRYSFIDDVLAGWRQVESSDSKSWYKRNSNQHLVSTLKVFKKYLDLCKDQKEKQACVSNLRYHYRQCFYLSCFGLCVSYFDVLKLVTHPSIMDRFIFWLSKRKVNVSGLYRMYVKLRFGY